MKNSIFVLFVFLLCFFKCEDIFNNDKDSKDKTCNFYIWIQNSEVSISGLQKKFRIKIGWIENKNDFTTSLITIYVYGDNEDYARVKPEDQTLAPGERSKFSTGWISGDGPTRYEFYCD